jgi:hypothetical protein
VTVMNYTSDNLAKNGPRIAVKLWLPRYAATELRSRGYPLPPPVELTAVVDTGASCTCIPDRFAKQLGLPCIGTQNVRSATSDSQPVPRYHLRVVFPDGTEVEAEALGAPWSGHSGCDDDAACFIGRDILSQGILIYHGINNSVSLIF